MIQLRNTVQHTFFLWLVLGVIWLVPVARYAMGDMVYGEFIHATGEMSARLMMLALAITPLRMLFPKQSWVKWLMLRRRHIGVAAFAFAVPHLAAYLIRLQPNRIAAEAIEPAMLTGWVAFVVFLLLAVTSNDWSMRWLGRRWKILHRLVYFAAALTFAHWILTAFDPLSGLLHLLVVAVLEGYRVWNTRSA